MLDIKQLEIAAKNGERMPDGLGHAEQTLYQGLRYLHLAYGDSFVDQATARLEKLKIMEQYRNNQLWENVNRQCIGMYNASEQWISRVTKSDCPLCQEIAVILTGRIFPGLIALKGRVLNCSSEQPEETESLNR